MRIQHNIIALNTNSNLTFNNTQSSKALEKLSTGFKINRAGDDAAGLAISEKMRAQIRGLNRAATNAQDSISLIQTAEGALNEVHSMLQRMSELAVQASNDTNTDEDRQTLQKEIAQIISEVDKVANTTEFNTMKLLDGTFANQNNNAGGGGTINNNNPIIAIAHDKVIAKIDPQNDEDELKPEWEGVRTMLDEEIVPQAVQAILNTFPDTFGYLEGSHIGIGLDLLDNSYSTALASVTMTARYDNAPIPDVDLGYTLRVNLAYVTWADNGGINGGITEASRRNLESTIVHEMMHAFMDESLTAGMFGRDQHFNPTKAFPGWFIEGTAQIAGGGSSYVATGLRIDGGTSVDKIKEVLSGQDNLKAGTNNAKYATGYLATMYLGHLASNGSMDAKDIASGIDKIMNDVRGGKSLSQSIADNTGGKYTSLADFEARFAQDGATFTKQLLGEIGMGRGALVTGDLTEDDLLEDEKDLNQTLFDLHDENETVWNYYPDGYIVMSGGQANQAGVAGPEHPASNNTGTGGNNQGTGGNQGGQGTQPTPPSGNTGTGGTQGGGNTGTGNTGGTGGNTGTGGTGTQPGGNNGGTQGGGQTGGNGGTQTGGNNGGTQTTPTTPKGALTFHVGTNGGQAVHLNIEAMSSASLGIDKVDLSTQQGANDAITIAHKAIEKVSTQRSQLGAIQNRLEYTINNLGTTSENLTSAESRIRDADMANEMMKFTKNNILMQAAQSMLAQANAFPQGVLNLIA